MAEKIRLVLPKACGQEMLLVLVVNWRLLGMVEDDVVSEEAGEEFTPYNLPYTRSYLTRVLHHAAFDEGYASLRSIHKGAGLTCSEGEFSKRYHGKQDRELSFQDCVLLKRYAEKHLGRSILYVKAEGDQTDHERIFSKAIAKAIAMKPSLAEFYDFHDKQLASINRLGLQSYYFSFKYSYRWHWRVLRSAAAIFSRGDTTLFVERQFNHELKQREDTVGLVFSKTEKLWIEAKEILGEQPRKFVFTSTGPSIDNITKADGRPSHVERNQIILGFSIEAYLKYPNQYGSGFGGFSSPVALQRVPEACLKALRMPEKELFAPAAIDKVLTFLTAMDGKSGNYQSKARFLRDSSINRLVRDHMKYYDWSDSNRPPK